MLCGLLTATLLTACGGGGSVWTEPNNNNNNNSNNERTETDFVEQTLVFKANRPIEFECIVGGALNVYLTSVFAGITSFPSSLSLSEEDS